MATGLSPHAICYTVLLRNQTNQASMDILFFFAGVAFYYFKSPYPLLFLGILLLFRPHPMTLLWFIAAIFWSMAHQWFIHDKNMPNTSIIQRATLEGHIISIPQEQPTKTQFQFSGTRLNNQSIKATFSLSCYEHCPPFKAGQHWQLQATLKKPQNMANPGGFDYVSLLNARHIQWIGNIHRDTLVPLNEEHSSYAWITYREQLANKQANMNPDRQTLGIFQALTLGLVNHIDKSQWDLFRRTGTTHLIDISGEHIALVAGLTYWLFKWAWRYMGPLCLRYPTPKIASIAAMIVASAYALLAGFAVPTQRSLITCFFILLRHLTNQRFSLWQSWRYSLLAVLLFEPHSIFMQGFYFSFIAVAILILINQRRTFNKLQRLMSMQLACLLGLMPLTLYWFSYGSLNGFFANLIAIPWVSFIIVPLALLLTFLSPWITLDYGIIALKKSMMLLLYYLQLIDSFAWINIQFTFVSALPSLALMGAMLLFSCVPLTRFFPAAAILVVASFFPNHEKIKMGKAQVDILDVGQGLAIIIRTAHHTLIYDTGMKFYQSSDIGQLVIIPYLNYLGIKQLDTVIISHPDLDHRGGLASLEAKYAIHELIVDDPEFYQRGVSCHDYPAWQWDQVSFRFFPIRIPLKSKNNRSCILQIRTQKEQLLLSGDIEKQAEDYLIKTYGHQLKSEVLVVPHHGSRTSSSIRFIDAIAPRYAVVSYGLHNRYHFPHKEAMAVYQQHHIPVYNTPTCGMVSVQLNKKSVATHCYRTIHDRDD